MQIISWQFSFFSSPFLSLCWWRQIYSHVHFFFPKQKLQFRFTSSDTFYLSNKSFPFLSFTFFTEIFCWENKRNICRADTQFPQIKKHAYIKTFRVFTCLWSRAIVSRRRISVQITWALTFFFILFLLSSFQSNTFHASIVHFIFFPPWGSQYQCWCWNNHSFHVRPACQWRVESLMDKANGAMVGLLINFLHNRNQHMNWSN